MATTKEIKEHLEKALEDVGEITPWFDKSVNSWIFSHKLYPVEYAGKTKEEVIKNYPHYLKEFIIERLNDNLAPLTEKRTKGRGGKREGSGRPKGTTKEPKLRVYLPEDLVHWIQAQPDKAITTMRKVMCKSKACQKRNPKGKSKKGL